MAASLPICIALLLSFQADSLDRRTGRAALEVKVRPAGMVTTSDPLTLHVEVANLTEHRLRLDSALAVLPDALKMGPRSLTSSLLGNGEYVELDSGQSVSLVAQFDRVPFHTAPMSALGYRCGAHEVDVRVFYRPVSSHPGDGMQPMALRTSVQTAVRPRSGLAAVIFGGIAGVLLASLLSFLYVWARPPTAVAESGNLPQKWRHRLGTEIRGFLYGVAVTAVSIYLLQATIVPGFPISISLCDPLGGMILGLFFRPVGQFVLDKITGTTAPL